MRVPGSSMATVTGGPSILLHTHTQDGSGREEKPPETTEEYFRGALLPARGPEGANTRMISLSAGGVISFHSTGERFSGYICDKASYGEETK